MNSWRPLNAKGAEYFYPVRGALFCARSLCSYHKRCPFWHYSLTPKRGWTFPAQIIRDQQILSRVSPPDQSNAQQQPNHYAPSYQYNLPWPPPCLGVLFRL